MTVLGKILVFVVLVLSLLWTYLTASAYAARTNWQAQAKQYQKAAQDAAASATAMKALLDSEREAAADQARVLRADQERYASTTKLIQDDRDALLKQYNELLDSAKKASAEREPLIGQNQKLTAEVGIKDDQIRQKDAELNTLEISKQAAVVRANEQANIAKTKTDQANTLADRVRALEEALETARRAGGVIGARPAAGGGVRVPAPADFRATVTGTQQVNGELLVSINLGLDAGLQKNTELTLSRLSGGGQYLGKLLITGVNPKDAVGKFIVPPGKRLAGADLPKAGDTATAPNN